MLAAFPDSAYTLIVYRRLILLDGTTFEVDEVDHWRYMDVQTSFIIKGMYTMQSRGRTPKKKEIFVS